MAFTTADWMATNGRRSGLWCPPSVRLRLVMQRLTRGKYMPPWQLREVEARLLKRISPYPGAHAVVSRAAIDPACFYVGMLDGHPPFEPPDRRFHALRQALNPKQKHLAQKVQSMPLPELLILKASL